MRSTPVPKEVFFYEQAGEIVKKARDAIRPSIKEGVRLLDVAESVERLILDEGARLPFPCTIAINDVASHYTPSRRDERVFKRGDLAKLDFGACVEGYIADAAFTVEVGCDAHAGLIEAAEAALLAGVAMIRPGVRVCEVGRAIEAEAISRGFNVLKELKGHSLGRYCLHGGLTIPAYDDGSDMRIREGEALAVEPFLTAGSGAVARLDGGNIYQLIRDDGIYAHGPEDRELLAYVSKRFGSFPFAERWLPRPERLQELVRAACVRSIPIMAEADGAPVAQAEHTVIVERDGCRIIA